MFAYLQGTVEEKGLHELILDVNGVGYVLTCSMNTLAAAPSHGEKMKVLTILSVREDAVELYGFSSQDEKKMFQRLTGVSGIGPKSAIGILSAMPLRDLTLAIMTGDTAALSRAPGVGKKTAQRIALELKESLGKEDFSASDTLHEAALPADAFKRDAVSEALSALQTLGYSASEAANAVNRVKNESDQADELVRLALRNMAGV